MLLFKIIKKFIKHPDLLKSNISYSQEGEDLILDSIMNNKKQGFYVDIGAHHPVRFSNTKIFYDRGWNGVNVDLINIDKFNKKRPKDFNICNLVGKNQSNKFYIFDDGALNTFSEEKARECEKAGYKIIEEKLITTKPLREILDECSVKKIDFMSIDVEGHEIEVLESNNWNLYCPDIILIEIHESLENIFNDKIYLFLKDKGYNLLCKTVRTCFF